MFNCHDDHVLISYSVFMAQKPTVRVESLILLILLFFSKMNCIFESQNMLMKLCTRIIKTDKNLHLIRVSELSAEKWLNSATYKFSTQFHIHLQKSLDTRDPVFEFPLQCFASSTHRTFQGSFRYHF